MLAPDKRQVRRFYLDSGYAAAARKPATELDSIVDCVGSSAAAVRAVLVVPLLGRRIAAEELAHG